MLVSDNRKVIFLLGLALFIASAFLGWNKLQYGFNFIDEGYHMTESWRLAQGDRFLDNKAIGPLMPFTIINSLIFELYPEMSLLDLRRLQYVFAIAALLIFSLSISAISRKYWHLPWVFSLFAFTGLDPTGMVSNLSYYTYPHLCLVLHLAFLLLGFRAANPNVRRIYFAMAGVFLWAVGFSLMHLSVVAISPVLLFILRRKLTIDFTFSDLLSILIPFAAGWLIFLAFNFGSIIPAILEALHFTLTTSSHSPGKLMDSFFGVSIYIGFGLIVLSTIYLCIRKLGNWSTLAAAAAISFFTYVVIETSLFGLVRPYYNGWFDRPMWFSGLLISFNILFWSFLASQLFRKKGLDDRLEFALVIMIPATILTACMIFFSGLKSLTVLHASIPITAALSIMFTSGKSDNAKPVAIRFLSLALLLAPFYYTTAWADWRFTYFDVVPDQANINIEEGFGRGIKTNALYARLYGWVQDSTERFTQEDDFIISYILSPMPHMIAKRRPALNDTYIDFSSRKPEVYQKAIRIMKERKREPSVAFVFERMPVLYPVSLKKGTYQLPNKQFDFEDSDDPISIYIRENMRPAGEFVVSRKDDYVVRCFIGSEIDL